MEVVIFKHYSFSHNVAISKRFKKLSMLNICLALCRAQLQAELYSWVFHNTAVTSMMRCSVWKLQVNI